MQQTVNMRTTPVPAATATIKITLELLDGDDKILTLVMVGMYCWMLFEFWMGPLYQYTIETEDVD